MKFLTKINGTGLITAATLAAALTASPAMAIDARCVAPGPIQVTDKSGDATTMSTSEDILSTAVAEPYVTAAGATPLLVFQIHVTDLNTLTPGGAYFTSFINSNDNLTYGVRMVVTNPMAPTFISYVASPSGGTTPVTDGRFVGTMTAAEAGSNYVASTGLITIYVKPASLNLTAPGQTLSGFNGGSIQNANPTGAGVNAAEVIDSMPDDLDRISSGTFTYQANSACAPNSPPVAKLTADTTTGNKPLLVNFSGLTSTDPDSASGDSVASYTFNFGDTSAAVTNTTGKVAHTYTKSGTYTATLSVSDTHGAASTSTANLAITAINKAPTVTLSAAPASGTKPLSVTFTATGADANTDDAPALVYTYDLDGDGTYEVAYSSATTEKQTYSTPGDYTISVMVKDTEGLTGVGTAKVHVDDVVQAKVDPFTFADRTGVAKSTVITSESDTLTGTGSSSLAISVSGGNSVQYSVNGGAFTSAAGTVNLGDKIVTRHTSSSADATSVTTSVTVGSYTTTFKSTTAAASSTGTGGSGSTGSGGSTSSGTVDHTPDAFDFGTTSGVAPGTPTESPVMVLSGFDNAPIVPGQYVSYRINGGTYTTATGTLVKGQTLQLRMTSNTGSLGYVKSYVSVGGVKGYFTVRTQK